MISHQKIIHCLKKEYGMEVSMLNLLPLGADMNASVYKADLSDRTSYFVKLKHGHNQAVNHLILELLQNAGIQQIIPPIKTTNGKTTANIEAFTLIVYPFVEGENGFSRDLTDDQWLKLGNNLRHIHEIEVPLSLQQQIRREGYSPKWRETVRNLYTLIEVDPIDDEIAFKLSKFMNKNITTIRRLVDRAEQLCQNIQYFSPKFVLCHSDIHGGNVLIDNDNNFYIIDWDDPIMAPKERDLMFIGGGVANVWNKPHEEIAFYKGYGQTEINMILLAYYRHERIVEDIALYGQALLISSTAGEDRAVMYQQFIDMFEPQGVIEIAFQTDKI